MARIARVVVPAVPHHVTARGNRRQPLFFEDSDYRFYRRLVGAAAARAGAEIWAYCLLPNHVHLIVTPADADGLRATFADAHRRYTHIVNTRFGWSAHLFQGRFGAVAMDEPHLVAAARYIALNPVKAGLTRRAEEWPWSSAGAHLAATDDELCRVAPLLERIPDFAALLAGAGDIDAERRLERAATIGRPLGSAAWLRALEARLGRTLAPRRPGPKPRLPETADDAR